MRFLLALSIADRETFTHAFSKEKLEPHTARAQAATHRDLFVPNPKHRLRGQLREVMRFHHDAVRTEETYWFWIRRFIFFHNKRHPHELGPAEVHAFLTHLATHENVAASTQNQALNALVFLYRRDP